MNSKGLRLGNLAQDQDGNLLKVIGLSTDPELVNEDIISFYVVDRTKFPLKKGWKAEFIPLSEKWLLKANFERHNRTVPFYTHSKTPIQIRFSKRNGVQMRVAYTKVGEWKSFPFLHQLQNVYFSFCGEELVFSSTEP